MDSFFGIGLPELIVILVLAGIIMGPHRIHRVARTLGRVTAQLQSISREFARQLNAELESLEGGDVKGTMEDMRTLQREVEALKRELSQVPSSLRDEGTKAVKEGEQALKGEEITPEDEEVAPVGDDAPQAVDGPRVEEDGQGVTALEPDSSETPNEAPRLPRALEVPGDPE